VAVCVNRIGESNIVTCGMKVTIIAYRKYEDIDVKFEDGAIREHVSYNSFKRGNIAYPVTRLGQEVVASCGMKMKIVEYLNSENVSVRFEDGTIRKNCFYHNFLRGTICNPSIEKAQVCSLEEITYLYYLQKIGFERKNRGYLRKFSDNWGNRELDMFNEELMLALEYDGGFWHLNKKETDISKDKLCLDTGIQLIRVRAIDFEGADFLNSGMSHEFQVYPKNPESVNKTINKIVDYINRYYNKSFKLDVDVVRDSEKIKAFYRKISMSKNLHVGETSLSSCGQKMTVKEYFNYDNITIEFEDGTIKKDVRYEYFLSGRVANPNYFQTRLNEEKTANCGMKMKIVQYTSSKNIVVQFEDGTLVNATYPNFKRGCIRNPNFSISKFKVS